MRSKIAVVVVFIALSLSFALFADNRVKTVVEGEIIYASDWNAEFDNIYANVTHSIAGTWTFTKVGTPITIAPASAPSANTPLFVVKNASGTTLFSVDAEGDVTQASGTASTYNALTVQHATSPALQLTLTSGGISAGRLFYNADVSKLNLATTSNTTGAGLTLGTSEAATFLPAATNVVPLTVNTLSSAGANTQDWRYNGTLGADVSLRATASEFNLAGRDLGNNVAGPDISIGRNTSSSTEGPTAGTLVLMAAGGTGSYLWVDAAGKIRINNQAPTGSSGSPSVSDTAGNVLGDQTSSLDTKLPMGRFTNRKLALREILKTPVYRFVYKSGAYNSQEFVGVITDYAPTFGKDRDAKHPGGKALNDITLFGYLISSIQELQAEIDSLKRSKAK